MTRPTISAILPTRNRPRLVVEAAASVLAQRLPPDELLVVDDGSAGEARRALGPLLGGARFPVHFLRGPGRGPGAARNVGIEAAAGELLAFIDDDDLWRPEKLLWQVERLAVRPGLGVLGTGVVRTDRPASLRRRAVGESARWRPISMEALIRANRLAMSSVVARRRCFEEVGGFDEGLSLAQDWDMWLRVAESWEVAALSAPLTVYRLHGDQRTAEQSALRRREAEVIGRALARGAVDRAAAAGKGLRGVARRRLAWAHCRLGRRLLREGNMEGAARELRESFSLFAVNPVTWGALARCALARRAPAEAERP